MDLTDLRSFNQVREFLYENNLNKPASRTPFNFLKLNKIASKNNDNNNSNNNNTKPTNRKNRGLMFTVFEQENLDSDFFPPEFICPVSLEVMENPVRLSYSLGKINHSRNYDKTSYEKFKGNGIDPMSKVSLKECNVTLDQELKTKIEDGCVHHMRQFASDLLFYYFLRIIILFQKKWKN